MDVKTVKNMRHTVLLEYFQSLIAAIENGKKIDMIHFEFVKSEILVRMK